MSQKIIYQSPDGGVCVVIPTDEYLTEHTMQELAEKDVPEGAPYEIVDVSAIPADRTFRDAWVWE